MVELTNVTKKVCTACGALLPTASFGIRVSAADGLNHQCRPCVRRRNKAYYERDKGVSAAQRAANYLKNRDRLLRCRRDHYAKNREVTLARQAANKARDREKFLDRARQSAKRCRNRINRYIRNRLATDPAFRQKEACRALLRACLQRLGTKKVGGTLENLGYTPAQFAQRMEVQFKPGMGWHNYGEWHIDHKIPVAHFIRKGELRPVVINALANLQPLWAKENLLKRDSHPLRG